MVIGEEWNWKRGKTGELLNRIGERGDRWVVDWLLEKRGTGGLLNGIGEEGRQVSCWMELEKRKNKCVVG